ncbi:MAG: glutamate--tRNA ligase [Rhodovibrionaceae bacterium]
MKLRFAPSPTGRLHVGNARMALLNWLHARQCGGVFLLRLDDTDPERSTEAYAEAIREDMAWLGLQWDELERQSARLARYDAAAEVLKAAGRLYPCYETAEELELKRRLQLKSGRPPLYDREALHLTAEERASLEAAGRRPHWRFKLAPEAVAWEDLVRGRQEVAGAHISDPVLIRADGSYLYSFTSVVDDIDLDVTQVLRGEDHVTNTAVQIQIFQALGGTAPAFGHFPLLIGAGGESLSKRLGSLTLESLRAEGLEPMALNAYLARLGTPDPIEPHARFDELVAGYDIARFGRATPKFSLDELWALNAKLLHALPYEAVEAWLAERGLTDFDEALWLAVRPNLRKRDDALDWHAVCRRAVAPVIEDADYLAAAAALLPPEPWDETAWGAWTAVLKEKTGRKGKALFHPLRLALTGREQGPELKTLLPLIGREKVEKRLRGEAA